MMAPLILPNLDLSFTLDTITWMSTGLTVPFPSPPFPYLLLFFWISAFSGSQHCHLHPEPEAWESRLGILFFLSATTL